MVGKISFAVQNEFNRVRSFDVERAAVRETDFNGALSNFGRGKLFQRHLRQINNVAAVRARDCIVAIAVRVEEHIFTRAALQ